MTDYVTDSTVSEVEMTNPQKQMVMKVVSKPMLTHKWTNKKKGMRESFITCKMKMRQGKGNRRDSITQIKKAASHQVDAVADATSSLGRGLKKSISTYSKEAGRFAKALGEFVDVEDILKSIHQVAYPEEHAKRKTSIVHTPIDWTKRTKPAARTFSENCPTIFESEGEEESDEDYDEVRNGIKEKNSVQELSLRRMELNQHQKTLPTISISMVQKHLDDYTTIPSSRRVSTRSLNLQQKNFEEQTEINNRKLSTSSFRLAQNVFEEKIMSSNTLLSASTINHAVPNRSPLVGPASTHIRRSSAPHILQVQADGCFSSRRSSQSQSQIDHIDSQRSNPITESNLPLYDTRQNCHGNPVVEMVARSTKGRRRSSCFLNVNNANTNMAFRCKSPIMRKKSSSACFDVG